MLKLQRTLSVRLVTIATFAIALTTTVVGCKADSNYFAVNNASVGSGDGSGVDATAGMRIRLKAKTGISGFIHKFGDATEDCEIPLASVDTPTSIQCMINMMEYDVWAVGYDYEVSVPANFCTYLRETPYRYYKYEPGYGPSTARIIVTNGAITTCTIDGIAGTINAASTLCSNSEASFNATGGINSCVYNHIPESGTPAAPNCCLGIANITLTNTSGATSTTTTSNVEYGGSQLACTESPNDYISEWLKTTSGYATTIITALNGASFAKVTKIPGPLKHASTRVARDAVFMNAGFHGWDDYAASPTTWDATVTIPRAIQPLVDRGAAGTHAGTGATAIGSYGDGSAVVDCLGPAGEIKQRIRVYTNAWNTIEDYQAYETDGDPTAVDPNRTGTAGVDCWAINGTASCNTHWGFDDMIKDTTAGWGGSGSAAAYVFPNELTNMPDPY